MVVGFRGCDILKSVEPNFMDIWQCTPLICFGVHSGGLLRFWPKKCSVAVLFLCQNCLVLADFCYTTGPKEPLTSVVRSVVGPFNWAYARRVQIQRNSTRLRQILAEFCYTNTTVSVTGPPLLLNIVECVAVYSKVIGVDMSALQDGDWSTWATTLINLDYTMVHSRNFEVHIHTHLFGVCVGFFFGVKTGGPNLIALTLWIIRNHVYQSPFEPNLSLSFSFSPPSLRLWDLQFINEVYL
jgi:hypothetical protein